MYYFTVFVVVFTPTVILSHSHYVKKRTHSAIDHKSEECDDLHHHHYLDDLHYLYGSKPLVVSNEVYLPIAEASNKKSLSKYDKLPNVRNQIRDDEIGADDTRHSSNRNVNSNVNWNVNTIIKKDVNRHKERLPILPLITPSKGETKESPESKEPVDYLHDHIKDDSSQDEDIEGVTTSPTPKLLVEILTVSPEVDATEFVHGEILLEDIPKKSSIKNSHKQRHQQNDQTSTEESTSKTSQDTIQDISKQQKDDRLSSTENPGSTPNSLSKSQEGEEEIKNEVKPKLHGDDEDSDPKKTLESSKEGKKGVGKRRRVTVAVPEDYVEVSVPSSNHKDDKQHETNIQVGKGTKMLDEDQEQNPRKNSDLKSQSAPSLRRMKFPKFKTPSWSASDLIIYGLEAARKNNANSPEPATRILEEERINSPIHRIGPKRAKHSKNLKKNKNVNKNKNDNVVGVSPVEFEVNRRSNKNRNVNKNSNRNVNNNRIRPSTSIESVPENNTGDVDYDPQIPLLITRRKLNKNVNRNVNRNVNKNNLRNSAEEYDFPVYLNDLVKSNRRALDEDLPSDLGESVERKNLNRNFNENKNKNVDRNPNVIRSPHSHVHRRLPVVPPHMLTRRELESLIKKYQDSERTFENEE